MTADVAQQVILMPVSLPLDGVDLPQEVYQPHIRADIAPEWKYARNHPHAVPKCFRTTLVNGQAEEKAGPAGNAGEIDHQCGNSKLSQSYTSSLSSLAHLFFMSFVKPYFYRSCLYSIKITVLLSQKSFRPLLDLLFPIDPLLLISFGSTIGAGFGDLLFVARILKLRL